MMNKMSNISKHDEQKTIMVLEGISAIVKRSFGPYGGRAMSVDTITKDGDDILKSVMFERSWQVSIKKLLIEATNFIGDREPGDGTTSIVLLITELFEELVKTMDIEPFKYFTKDEVIQRLVKVVELIKPTLEENKLTLSASALVDLFTVSLNNDSNNAKALVDIMKIKGIDPESKDPLSQDELDSLMKITLTAGSAKYLRDTYKIEEVAGFSIPSIPAYERIRDNDNLEDMECVILPFADAIADKESLELWQAIVLSTANLKDVRNILVVGYKLNDYIKKVISDVRSKLTHSTKDGFTMLDNFLYLELSDLHNPDDWADLMAFMDSNGLKLTSNIDGIETAEMSIEDVEEQKRLLADRNRHILTNLKKYIVKVENGRSTTIIPVKKVETQPKSLENRIAMLKSKLETDVVKNDPKFAGEMKARLFNLEGNSRVILEIGGESSSTLKKNMSAYKDAYIALISAIKHGVTCGMGLSVINACRDYIADNRNQISEVDGQLLRVLIDTYSCIPRTLIKSAKPGLDRLELCEEVDILINNQNPTNLVGSGEVLSTLRGELVLLDKLIDVVGNLFTVNTIIHDSIFSRVEYDGIDVNKQQDIAFED